MLTAPSALHAAVDWRRTNEARHGLYQVISDTLGKLDVTYTMPAVHDGQGCAYCYASPRSIRCHLLCLQERRPAAAPSKCIGVAVSVANHSGLARA